MFGYIRPMECELRVREQKEYRAHYCGLCKAIGARYGLFARLLLNYDCAFLSAFLAAYTGEFACDQRCCLCHPLRQKQPMAVENELVAYVADVNVLLSWYAARDNWKDERKLSSLLTGALFSHARKLGERRQPALSEQIRAALDRLDELERANATCTDEPSDAFGSLMRAVIRHAPQIRAEDRSACEWMFYNLGRWIYLADAWDDREKDRARGRYNPLNAAGIEPADAEFLLNASLSGARKGYDLIPLSGLHGLVDNIMSLGCDAVTRRLLMNKEKPNESV